MKKIIRTIIGTLLILIGVFFACMAVYMFLNGQKIRLVTGAFYGALAFITAGAMTISKQAWREILELFLLF